MAKKRYFFLSLFIVFINLILLLVVYEGREFMGLESVRIKHLLL